MNFGRVSGERQSTQPSARRTLDERVQYSGTTRQHHQMFEEDDLLDGRGCLKAFIVNVVPKFDVRNNAHEDILETLVPYANFQYNGTFGTMLSYLCRTYKDTGFRNTWEKVKNDKPNLRLAVRTTKGQEIPVALNAKIWPYVEERAYSTFSHNELDGLTLIIRSEARPKNNRGRPGQNQRWSRQNKRRDRSDRRYAPRRR